MGPEVEGRCVDAVSGALGAAYLSWAAAERALDQKLRGDGLPDDVGLPLLVKLGNERARLWPGNTRLATTPLPDWV